MICLCLTGETIEENQEYLRRYRNCIDLVELRLDLLSDSELDRLRGNPGRLGEMLTGVQRLVTCRRLADGGAWSGDERERCRVLGDVLDGPPDWIDLEDDLSDELEIAARERGVGIVRSIHCLDSPPADVPGILDRLSRGGALAKLAVAVSGTDDVRRLVESVAQRAPGTHIVLGMGEYGLMTRLLARRIGSAWTYTSAHGAVQAAPGQVDPRTLVERYGFRRIGPDTALFGVVGDPIAHSRSPEYHNARFQRDNLDAVYLPFRVDDLRPFMSIAHTLPLHGMSVTVPHKSAAAKLADHTDDAVRETGACNTLIREHDSYLGTNTDVPGFLQPLTPYLDAVDGATIVGAGGAARAIAYALVTRGMDVLIVNRTVSRAEALASDMNRAAERIASTQAGVRPGRARAGAIPNSRSDIAGFGSLIVQTTSCGMEPNDECDPIPEYRFDGSEVVYDIVYTPATTTLLERAERAGCRVISGALMFEQQAAVQYDLFRRAYWSFRRSRDNGTRSYDGVRRDIGRAPWSRQSEG